MSAMYAVYHGPKGLKNIALRVHNATLLLAEGMDIMLLLSMKYFSMTWFEQWWFCLRYKTSWSPRWWNKPCFWYFKGTWIIFIFHVEQHYSNGIFSFFIPILSLFTSFAIQVTVSSGDVTETIKRAQEKKINLRKIDEQTVCLFLKTNDDKNLPLN